ncbi:MAG: molybdenum cofactor biosynthesis protein MoaE [Allosphingosinicella sp.]|uniref:molybdenum cofactor biosynthesis protein MoaE n=1 Tax=Allosphingosinicella sp. TaxID=2823234 RepID=UPI003937241A
MIDVRVQSADFDPGRQIARLGDLKMGAVASFTALLDVADDVEEILVDHYPALAKVELGRIAADAEARWPLGAIILIHRHGRLAPCDRLAFVGVAAADRRAAFDALAFLADALATRPPFWRKELTAGGGGRWTR